MKKKKLKKKLDHVQAKLDAVMLEFCPNEMTKKQLKVWGKNQRPAK